MARPPAVRPRFEPLGDAHDIAGFDCGVRLINTYLTSGAELGQEFMARLFVAVEPGRKKVLAFYAMHGHSIGAYETPPPVGPRLDRRAMVPVVYIPAFGVDKRLQGRGLGGWMMADALRRARAVAKHVGMHAVVLDAYDDKAQKFYERLGFRLIGKPRRMYLQMATIPARP